MYMGEYCLACMHNFSAIGKYYSPRTNFFDLPHMHVSLHAGQSAHLPLNKCRSNDDVSCSIYQE